jgi:hypothetical protein
VEFLPNKIEFEHLEKNKLTRYDEGTGHYTLEPQRGCFVRCKDCLNLKEADSSQHDGQWEWKPECLFCVQRVIDLLGWYEHKIVPKLNVSDRSKERKRDLGGIYDAIMASISPSDEEIEAAGIVGDEPLEG